MDRQTQWEMMQRRCDLCIERNGTNVFNTYRGVSSSQVINQSDHALSKNHGAIASSI